MAELVRQKFNSGLSLVRPAGLLNNGESHKAENVVFSSSSVKRRRGKATAYQPTNPLADVAVSCLKRFYKLGTTGTVTPTMVKAHGSLLSMTTTDWSDDTGTVVVAAAWTDLPLPRTSNSSLVSGANVTVTSGAIRNAFESNSWCYLYPQYAAADDASDRTNVPMRTNAVSGTPRTFLMGLSPPGQPTTAEINVGTGTFPTGSTYYYRLTAEYDTLKLGESGPGLVSALETIAGAVNADIRVTVPAMTSSDVTRINIYRTLTGGAVDSTYYFVGFVAGAGGGTFDDNIPDATAVASLKTLDLDKYMPPKFRTGCIWKDRAVIANLKVRDTDLTTELDAEEGGIHKNRIRFSDGFKPDVFRKNDFIDLMPDGTSGSIKRVIVNPLIDALFAFMEEDVVALQGDSPTGGPIGTPFRPRNVAQSKGTPSPDSVVEAKGLIFYWTKEGIEVIDGFRARNITSDTIAPLWNSITAGTSFHENRINMDRIDQVVALYHPSEERIYWSYPSATSTTNNAILVLDLDLWRMQGYGDGVFSIYTGWDISCFERWGGEGDRGEIFGGEAVSTDSNWVYRIEFKDADANGSRSGAALPVTTLPIPSKLWLGLDAAGRPDLLKDWKSTRIEAKSGLCTAHIILDVDQGALLRELGSYDFRSSIGAWGSIVWGEFTWSGPRIERQAIALPREAKGIRAGLRFETEDFLNASSVGPEAFELYDLSWSVVPLATKVRR